MDKEVIDALLEENPKLAAYAHKLQAMQPGSYCVHRTWGFGQIKRYDAQKRRIIIDFETESERKEHPMDPAFCVDKLEVLPDSHIFVKKHTQTDRVAAMIKDHPADLVIEVLSQSPDQEMGALELERLLKHVVGSTKYRKWWTLARKALDKDPRIAVPVRSTDPYIFRQKPVRPEEEILEQFYAIKSPKKKILLAEKLYELSDSVESLASDLPQVLKDLAQVLKEAKSLTQADRLHGVWVRNSLARHLHEDVDQLEPSSASILKETNDLSLLAEDLPSAYYKRLMELLVKVYPEPGAHQARLLDLLRNSTGKLTQECITFLIDRGHEALLRETFLLWQEEHSLKAPVLHWMVKNRHVRRYHSLLSVLMNGRLLQGIFGAIDVEALQASGNRRIPLADEVCEDASLIPDLLTEEPMEVARDLAQVLMLSQGFDDLSKRSLMARFIKLYPSIQSLLSGTEQKQGEDSLIVSKSSFEAYKKAYEHLVSVEIPENKAALAQARDHGDLRENAEYKIAKEEQTSLLARKAQMERELRQASVTDFQNAPSDCVGIGSIVHLVSEKSNKKMTYTILGAWDSAPDRNILSYKTPLAREILYKKAGESLQLPGEEGRSTWRIERIERWVDQS